MCAYRVCVSLFPSQKVSFTKRNKLTVHYVSKNQMPIILTTNDVTLKSRKQGGTHH